MSLPAFDVAALFRSAGMFESRRTWAAAGFQVIDRANNGKIMVARHASAPGLLFKKYDDDVALKEQLKNYRRRIEGSERLRAFVASRQLSRLVVPHKRLVELPRAFSRRETSYILVVELLAVLDDDQTKAAYRRIAPEVLLDLCTVLGHFRGMDSNTKNLPFTADGRIALIDTEHWDRTTSKSHLHHVGEYLSEKSRKLAKRIFEQIEDGDDVDDDLDDFYAEEDTSSSSSS